MFSVEDSDTKMQVIFKKMWKRIECDFWNINAFFKKTLTSKLHPNDAISPMPTATERPISQLPLLEWKCA